MEFYDVVKKRRSIRAFKNEPIDKDALKRIGEAVNLAPSAQI
jgi:nitroreductase